MAPALRPPGSPPAGERSRHAAGGRSGLVQRLLADAPVPAATVAVAVRLTNLLRRQGGATSAVGLDAAGSAPLAGFAAGLRREIEALQAALELPWTTSPVEGQPNRLKTIERSM